MQKNLDRMHDLCILLRIEGIQPENHTKEHIITRNKKNTMKTKEIPERYFAYSQASGEIGIVEVTKEEFDSLDGEVSTERHTMSINGCNQVCHTKFAFIDED